MSRAQVLQNPAHRDIRNASTRVPSAVTFPQLIAILLPISFALMGMMVGGYLRLHSDISDLRGELHSDISDLHGELHSDISDLRGELHSDISDLRGELRSNISDLREDMRENHEILIANQIELAEGLARIEGYMAAQSEQD